MNSKTIRRLHGALLAVAALAAASPQAAGATAAGWYSFTCTAPATWTVDPLARTAHRTVHAGGTCLTVGARAEDTGKTDVWTTRFGTGEYPNNFAFAPIVNATDPAGSFAGTVTSGDDPTGWKGTGAIAGVSGGAFEGEIVWTKPSLDQLNVDHYVGVGGCGPYCFETTLVWTSSPLHSAT